MPGGSGRDHHRRAEGDRRRRRGRVRPARRADAPRSPGRWPGARSSASACARQAARRCSSRPTSATPSALERAGRAGRRRVRTDRLPARERRHRRPEPRLHRRSRALAGGRGDEPARCLLLRPRGAAADAGPGLGAHLHHVVRLGPRVVRRRAGLHRDQVGPGRLHARPAPRAARRRLERPRDDRRARASWTRR